MPGSAVPPGGQISRSFATGRRGSLGRRGPKKRALESQLHAGCFLANHPVDSPTPSAQHVQTIAPRPKNPTRHSGPRQATLTRKFHHHLGIATRRPASLNSEAYVSPHGSFPHGTAKLQNRQNGSLRASYGAREASHATIKLAPGWQI